MYQCALGHYRHRNVSTYPHNSRVSPASVRCTFGMLEMQQMLDNREDWPVPMTNP